MSAMSIRAMLHTAASKRRSPSASSLASSVASMCRSSMRSAYSAVRLLANSRNVAEASKATTLAPSSAIRRAKIPAPQAASSTISPAEMSRSRSVVGATRRRCVRLPSSPMWESHHGAICSQMAMDSWFRSENSCVMPASSGANNTNSP